MKKIRENALDTSGERQEAAARWVEEEVGCTENNRRRVKSIRIWRDGEVNRGGGGGAAAMRQDQDSVIISETRYSNTGLLSHTVYFLQDQTRARERPKMTPARPISTGVAEQ
jgi:8-oxo-dGTP pyrophosphatase MutT (NUDIX family)